MQHKSAISFIVEIDLFYRMRTVGMAIDRKMADYDCCQIDWYRVYMDHAMTTMADTRCKVVVRRWIGHRRFDRMKKVYTDHMLTVSMSACMDIDRMLVDIGCYLIDHMVMVADKGDVGCLTVDSCLHNIPK